MTALEETEEVFSIFHDGSISSWQGDKSLLRLEIDCPYLAERLDKSYDHFYIELVNVRTIELQPWKNPIAADPIIVKELNEIFEGDLEILSAESSNETVVVTCQQWNTKLDYRGATLIVGCEQIRIYDQSNKELSLDRLQDICKDYWEDWSKETENQ
ncbi:MAG TPA: hypothetical protein VEY71_06940 [Chitinophagales bacterium]|nr:hypothetical protein [Chitinophagales bacterium]